jgi:hypothetical protein
MSTVSTEINIPNIPNIKISATDLEVLEKNTLFFPEELFKKEPKNETKKEQINTPNIYFSNKPKLYTIKPLTIRPLSHAMKFT